MTAVHPDHTLADLVLEQPARARFFEELELDYCCGGTRSLGEAAAERGLDARTLTAALEAAEEAFAVNRVERDWRRVSLSELCDHIVDGHHAYLRRELPRIADLLGTVVARHGDTLPPLATVEARFAELRDEIIDHIDREEEIAFPLCRRLDEEDVQVPEITPQIEEHEAAHEEVGRRLAELRELTDGYDTEAALCATHRALLEALRELERDLHQHIHEENNILFPRLRERLGAARPSMA